MLVALNVGTLNVECWYPECLSPCSLCMCVMQVEMIAWMEKELKQGDQAVVLVTHDR